MTVLEKAAPEVAAEAPPHRRHTAAWLPTVGMSVTLLVAEPSTIGVSLGAAVGAVASISLGLTFLGNWTLPAMAFVAGLGTVLLVYAMSRSGGRTEVVTLILMGIAVNAFAGALIGLFIFLADTAAVNQITFWQLGSLAQSTWRTRPPPRRAPPVGDPLLPLHGGGGRTDGSRTPRHLARRGRPRRRRGDGRHRGGRLRRAALLRAQRR
jgi:FecCD transport family protein